MISDASSDYGAYFSIMFWLVGVKFTTREVRLVTRYFFNQIL